MLYYTNDALVVSENAEQVLRTELGRYWTLKEESIGPPKIYLGELDASPELQPTDAQYHMSLIGMLRWIVELGRFGCMSRMLYVIISSGVSKRRTLVSTVPNLCVPREVSQY